MLQVQRESHHAGAGFEAGHQNFVTGNDAQPGQRHGQRVMMKQRHAQQRQREQDEIYRDAEQHGINSLPYVQEFTSMTCTRYGPCAPKVSVCSISAVRDGPEMKFTARGG